MATVMTQSGRRYPFHDGPMHIRMDVADGGGAYLRHLADTWPKEFARALKSAGFQLRKSLQDDIYAGGPKEQRWSPLSGMQALGVVDDAKGRHRVPRTHPMGRLVRAVGYRYNQNTQSVRVGWLSHQAAKMGGILQPGFDTQVTPRMRRFLWAIGVPVAKAALRTPPRDLFDTVIRHREREIHNYVERRVHEFVRRSGRFQWAA